MFGQGFNYGFLGKPPCFTDTTDIFKDNSGVALYTLDYDASSGKDFTTNTLQILGDTSCIATYPLEGSSTDLSGNYSGTDTNITYTSGYFGQSASFNGSSSTIQLSGGDMGLTFGSSASYSISFWFNTSNVSTWQRVFNTCGAGGNSANQIAASLYLSKLYIYRRTGTSTSVQTLSSSALQSNTWYNTVLTVDGSSVKLYLNGVEETLTVSGSTVISSVSNIIFGSHGYTPYFNGSMDQIRLFNKTLTSSEVTTLYNEIGERNGTPTNVDFGVGGKSLYGARFNGSSSRVDLPNFFGITDSANFSASLWFNSNSTANQSLLWANGSGAVGRFGIGINNSSYGGAGAVYFGCGLSSFTYINSSGGTFSQGDWVHVAVAKSSTTGMTLYVNGTQVANNSSATGNASNTATGSNTIGVYKTGSYSSWYNGSIDQVRIFNKALSSTEVSKLYGNGAGEIACTYKSTTDIVNYPTGTTPIAYYKLDNSSEDYSTGGYDGTDKNNIQYRFGKYGQAAVFDGINSHILLPTGSPFNDSNTIKTISGWVKRSGSGGIRLFSISDTGFNFIAVNILDTGLHFTNRRGSSSNQLKAQSLQSIDNNWHHVAIVYDASGIKWYLDGQEQTVTYTTTGTATNSSWISYPAYSGTPKAYIGRSRQNTPSYANGKIDQVRIYDAALTSDQVTELYNEKPELDTSNFKTVLYEGNGSTQYISNVGFDLDVDNGGDGGLVWLKERTSTSGHQLRDSVRGVSNVISSNLTNAETSNSNLTSFDANGFTLGVTNGVNESGQDYVAWVWKGGGDAVSNTDGDITSQVSANTDAGFSIVKYVGNGVNSSLQKVGTGLNQECDIVFIKTLDSTASWVTQRNKTDVNKYLYLNDTRAESTSTAFKVDINTNEGTFGFTSNNLGVNQLNQNYIAYCFHSVSGYSKIGSFVGDGSTDTVLNLGFEPKWIMIKNANTTTGWFIMDFPRDNFAQRLKADTNSSDSGINTLTTSSTGITISSTASDGRINGRPSQTDTMIYMAFK